MLKKIKRDLPEAEEAGARLQNRTHLTTRLTTLTIINKKGGLGFRR